MSDQETVKMCLESYQDGIKMGHGDVINYLRGVLGEDSPILHDVIVFFDEQDGNND